MLAICVPVGNGTVTVETTQTLLQLQRDLDRKGICSETIFHEGSHVDRVRNELSARFMETTNEYSLWLDTDVSSCDLMPFVYRVLKHSIPLAAAAYRTKQDEVNVNVNYQQDQTIDNDGFLRVKEAGAGCMLIHRSIFEALQTPERAYHGHPNTPVEGPLYDYWSSGIQTDSDGVRRYISEDYAFCRAARRAGYNLLLDTTIRLGHTGKKTWVLE